MKKITKGVVFALIAACISGVSIWYAKVSVAKVDPLVLASLRNAWAGMLFLVFFVGTQNNRRSEKIIQELSFKKYVFLFLSGSIPFALFFIGLKEIGAIQGNIIQKTMFVFASGIAFFLLKEHISVVLVICYMVLLALIAQAVNFSLSIGFIFVTLAMIIWSFEQVFIRAILKEDKKKSLHIGIIRMLGGSLILILISLVLGKGKLFTTLSLSHISTILIGGTLLFGYVYSWFRALSALSVTKTTFFLTFAVPVGTLLQYILVGKSVVIPTEIYYSIGIICIAPLALYLLKIVRRYESFL